MNDVKPAVGLSDVVRRAARRRRVVVGAIVAGVALGGAAAIVMPREYTATATLTVSPISLDPLSSVTSNQQININTEREVLRSSEVARIAAASLGDVDSSSLQESSAVAAPSQSQVLQVSVTSSAPEAAAERANAMAEAYLAFRAEGAAALASGRIAELDSRIAAAEERDDDAAILDLQTERSELQQVSENPGRIIGVAEPPLEPSSLAPAVYVVAGAAAGLLLGIVLALVREATDRRVRSAERLAERTGREAVVVGERTGDDAYRWMMRALRAPFTGSRPSTPLVVAVVAIPPASSRTVVESLRDLAVETGSGTALLGLKELPATRLDRPWKYTPQKGAGVSVVLVDAAHIQSGARLAALADAANAALIVTAEDSPIAEVHARIDSITRSRLDHIVTVFLEAPAGVSTARSMRDGSMPWWQGRRRLAPALRRPGA